MRSTHKTQTQTSLLHLLVNQLQPCTLEEPPRSHPHPFKSGQRPQRPQRPEGSEGFDRSEVREAHQVGSQADQGDLRENQRVSAAAGLIRRTASRDRVRAHVYDEKVKPAPSVGEVGLEAVGDPFQEHLNDKDEGENFVSKLQDDLDGSSSFDVYVLKRLRRERQDAHASTATTTHFLKVSPQRGRLTRAPLLRRIIKMMKVSNQSCSTMVKQVLRRFHHFFPLPWVTSTFRHGQCFTQSEPQENRS